MKRVIAQWSTWVGVGLAAFATLAFVISPVLCFLLAIWVGDGRWGWTGLVLCVPAAFLLIAWTDTL